MLKKLSAFPLVFLAFLILGVSIYRASSVKYVFSQAPTPAPVRYVHINYALPSLSFTPDSPLWAAQVLIDKVEPALTEDGLVKARMYLEDADRRLVAGKQMYDKGRVEESFVVFQKSEGYLSQSYKMAVINQNPEEKEIFLLKLSMASLKHREILETILSTSPEDGRSIISRLLDTPKSVYDMTSGDLRNFGFNPPQNPF